VTMYVNGTSISALPSPGEPIVFLVVSRAQDDEPYLSFALGLTLGQATALANELTAAVKAKEDA
jgi:hypothetical protein